MHIDIIDDFNMVIYIKKSQIKTNLNNKDDLQECFKELFIKLKEHYNININGFYNIKVYCDKYYGIILELQKEDIDYMDYFDGQVDMNITLDKNGKFLYEISDYFDIDSGLFNKAKIYKYNDKLYLNVVNSISSINIGRILEFGKIVYGQLSKQIIKYGKELKIPVFK